MIAFVCQWFVHPRAFMAIVTHRAREEGEPALEGGSVPTVPCALVSLSPLPSFISQGMSEKERRLLCPKCILIAGVLSAFDSFTISKVGEGCVLTMLTDRVGRSVTVKEFRDH